MFLTGLEKEQNLFIYASAVRMLGITIEEGDSNGEERENNPPNSESISTATTNQLIGFRGDNGGTKNLISITLSTLRAEANVVTGNKKPNLAELFPEDKNVRAVSSFLLRKPPEGKPEEARETLAKLFQDQWARRAAMFELVDIALTIILHESDSPPEDLVSEAGNLLKKGREENQDIGFVLSFAEEALLPPIAVDGDGAPGEGSKADDRLADFATASAEIMTASLEVSKFVESGNEPWGGEGDENVKPDAGEEGEEQGDASPVEDEPPSQ